jgi:DNA polymerase-3 subunit beta
MGKPGIILPRKTVQELAKLLADHSDGVSVNLSANKIRFTVGNVVLTSKLIDGTFPDYQRVVPQGNDKIMRVDTAAFISAVDRVSTLSSEKGRAVKLNMADDRLVLSVNNPESGSATEELGTDYGGTPLEIGFNARYLLDISGQFEGDRAVFKLSDPSAPTVLQDETDQSALYVLMPMRV